ncbi:MAG: sugar phosphate isomerase/epimerase [Lentisphaeria bacterium]|nr:sugar phosphate isomerase/epimerase [Lentisphaeria bacterium]
MTDIPITFLYDFTHVDALGRVHIMHEFAANGAKHLVLSDSLINAIMTDRNVMDQLNEEIAGAGLTFADSHAIFGKFLDLNCPIPEARPQMLLRHELSMQIVADMGVNTITIHTGNETVYPDYPLETQFDCLKKSLDHLLPLAEKLGIVICIENVWFQINTPERLLAVKSCFPTDALGFCYDAGHANLMNKGRFNPESKPCKAWKDLTPQWDDQILEKMLPHVVNCHLHDNIGITDQHRNPGSGTVDWDHIMPLLGQAPRLKVIQSEVLPVMANVPIRNICDKISELVQKM